MTNTTKMTKQEFINRVNKVRKDRENIDFTKASKEANTFVHSFLLMGLVSRGEIIDEIALDINYTLHGENEHQAIHTFEETESSMTYTSKYENMEIVSLLDFENSVFELETR
ncbi:hypothetical protein [Bacillus nitratireducens]|uniref:hypothetical protein n=1 Tax=Bacillus nitratireducens TaxID=2026193 RepID=UPI0008961C2E|nr:hypothetical protein [Bacillus nitratireducens]SEA91514.1 hypothetical protein SAMN04488146_104420 [Bacillus nitratireducens]